MHVNYHRVMINAEAFSREVDWHWPSHGLPATQAVQYAEDFSSLQIARTAIEDPTGAYRINWQHLEWAR